MAISFKHAFASAKGDTPDATFIQPSHWNAEHVLSCAANSVIGRAGTSGAVQEIATTAFGRTLMAAADAAAAKLALGIESFAAGTKMLFIQTTAPTGWTKDTTHNNKALRIVSGTAGSGGTVDFTAAFTSRGVTGSTDGTALDATQIPAHTHSYNTATYPGNNGNAGTDNNARTGVWWGGSTSTNSGSAGSGAAHTHTLVGVSIDLAVKYVDAIIATKD